ncbi:MAG: hypothetical protein RLZZ244_343 [Verrucomicrobiota bacterium]|jgi:putative pyruvate formate lyase activating enzyme
MDAPIPSVCGLEPPRRDGGRSRRRLAAGRVEAAHRALANCRFCAHECGVNRLRGERGPCRAGAESRVFWAQTEVSDEREIVPTYALALSGCDLRCAFCITGEQSWNPSAGEPLRVEQVVAGAAEALRKGARSVMILGGEPTIHLPAVLELVAALPEEARLVWKTNGHASAEGRALLAGLFDVWLVDFKFGNDACAERLAGVKKYGEVLRENLLWSAGEGELIVRHLLMPGHGACCWEPAAAWLAAHLPGVRVSLMRGFWPGWKSHRHAELLSTVGEPEYQRALEVARHFSLNVTAA